MVVKGDRLRNWMFVLVIAIFALLFVGGNVFTVVDFGSEEVYLPQYLSASCSARADNLAPIEVSDFGKSGEYYGCDSYSSGKYIPDVNGISCRFDIDSFSSYRSYDCPSDGASLSDCTKLNSFLGANSQQTYYLDVGRYLYAETGLLPTSDGSVIAFYPSYGLVVETADGRDFATTLSCELNSLSGRDIHTIDAPNFVVPDVPFNAVSVLSRAISTQVTSIVGVEGGDEIYVSNVGYYQLIKESDDGFRYVDTSAGERSSSLIECFPLTTGCSADAKINDDLEEQACSAFGGTIVGYAPVSGDTTKVCKYECVDNFNKVTTDCIAITRCTDPDYPLWNTQTGECDRVDVLPPTSSGSDNVLIIIGIVLGVLIIILVMVVIAQSKKKGGKR